MGVSDEKRKEITAWATQKAFDDAEKAGKKKPSEFGADAISYDCWITERIWHYEKMAYLKIHNRDLRTRK